MTIRKEGERLCAIYHFICEYKMKHDGASPTFREIGKACGITSTSVVRYNLSTLEGQGLITVEGGRRARGITVTGSEGWKPPEWCLQCQKHHDPTEWKWWAKQGCHTTRL